MINNEVMLLVLMNVNKMMMMKMKEEIGMSFMQKYKELFTHQRILTILNTLKDTPPTSHPALHWPGHPPPTSAAQFFPFFLKAVHSL